MSNGTMKYYMFRSEIVTCTSTLGNTHTSSDPGDGSQTAVPIDKLGGTQQKSIS